MTHWKCKLVFVVLSLLQSPTSVIWLLACIRLIRWGCSFRFVWLDFILVCVCKLLSAVFAKSFAAIFSLTWLFDIRLWNVDETSRTSYHTLWIRVKTNSVNSVISARSLQISNIILYMNCCLGFWRNLIALKNILSLEVLYHNALQCTFSWDLPKNSER